MATTAGGKPVLSWRLACALSSATLALGPPAVAHGQRPLQMPGISPGVLSNDELDGLAARAAAEDRRALLDSFAPNPTHRELLGRRFAVSGPLVGAGETDSGA